MRADACNAASAESMPDAKRRASCKLRSTTAKGNVLLKVDTVSGHAGMAEPVAFWLGEKRIEVLEIVDRWPAKDYTYFKVATSDLASYILRHDAEPDTWELTLYKSPGY